MTNCSIDTKFKGINNIAQDLLLNILEANFKMYLDWAFLNIGAWFDVSANQNTIYGVNRHSKLLPVEDPAYANGRVWQGIRKDWVWEAGINYNNTSPSAISNISVNSNTVTKNGNFIVNYPLGRVIFNTAQSLTSNIQLNYSYRFVQVHRSSESPWFNILQFSSFNTSNNDIQLTDDGEWAVGGQHRIQLPCIVIEPVSRT